MEPFSGRPTSTQLMEFHAAAPEDLDAEWVKVSECGVPANGGRIHVTVEGRVVTVFRHKEKLSAIDSVW